MTDGPLCDLDLSVLDGFAPYDGAAVDAELARALARLGRKIVVLDDDPTGVQTVHGVSVFTDWAPDSIFEGFKEPAPMFFILTNSRGMTADETAAVHAEAARGIAAASRATGKPYIVISRSDSTLRGHFPLETETLRRVLEADEAAVGASGGGAGGAFDGEIICPFFLEGGRFTIGDVHYVREDSKLRPAASTEFARDRSFGYKNSHLGRWIEEKTGGAYPAGSVTYITLDELRARDYGGITDKLTRVSGFGKVVVNAVGYEDIKVFITAFCGAAARGKRYIFRSAAAVTKVLGGICDKPLLTREELLGDGGNGGDSRGDGGASKAGVVVIGSHVQKTTAQLIELKKSDRDIEFIEFDQHLFLSPGGLAPETLRVTAALDRAVAAGRTAVVYTRRDRLDLDTDDPEAQLRCSVAISDAVTGIVGGLRHRPAFIVAKGGITSSDIGKKALMVRRATVAGQVSPGIPVWRAGPESRFPGLPYVIFPGNVGEPGTLRKIVEMLTES